MNLLKVPPKEAVTAFIGRGLFAYLLLLPIMALAGDSTAEYLTRDLHKATRRAVFWNIPAWSLRSALSRATREGATWACTAQ